MEVYNKDPFKRGVMRFEDYNYNIYNKYILIDTDKGAKLNKMGYNNISKMDSDQLRLTQSQLSQSVHENYIFDDIQGCLPSLVKVEEPPSQLQHQADHPTATAAEVVEFNETNEE